MPDVSIYASGMLCLATLQSEKAADWAAQNIDSDEYPCSGATLPVEGRRAPDLIRRMIERGLDVEINGDVAYIGFGDAVCIDVNTTT